MKIRRLTAADARAYRDLRLRGLREHPEAFTSSFEEERTKSLAWVRKRLAPTPESPRDFTLGAFVEAKLAGVVSLSVAPRVKARHKGHVFGMYVAREHAGSGVGRGLLDACIARARRIPRLEQLELTVTESNVRAVRLYVKAGFQTFGVERNALKVGGRYFNKCHMALDLRR